MSSNKNIILFPNKFDHQKEKYIQIRDEIESLLFKYANDSHDLWAVCLAAGRFSAMNLEKIDGKKKALEFFECCIDTQNQKNIK